MLRRRLGRAALQRADASASGGWAATAEPGKLQWLRRASTRTLFRSSAGLRTQAQSAARTPLWRHGGRHLTSGGGEAVTEAAEPSAMVPVPKQRLQELMEAEVHYLATVPLVSVSLRDIINCPEPHRAARLVQEVVPMRVAHRIRMIESLSGWQEVPELVMLREMLSRWYMSLRLLQQTSSLEEVTACARSIRVEGKDSITLITPGIHKLKQLQLLGDKYSGDYLDRWLDDYFLSRIGANLLLDQFYALAPTSVGGKGRPLGIVDPNSDVIKICRQAEAYARQVTSYFMGAAPPCIVEAYKEGISGPVAETMSGFSCVPSHLRYIMIELLKNSFKASVAFAESEADLENRAVHVLVARSPLEIAIRVSDRAGGIPSEAGDRIFSYLYGAAAKADGPPATALSGYGVGLPLSRLHARYLGGNLTITSFAGHGTDAVLVLPRLSVDMVEEMPSELDQH